MTGGYTGKILRVNLTKKSIGTIPTEKYEPYCGGHGMGSAVFFDLVGDQLPFPAFDPRNLIIIMNHPFAGTFMPASGRCEVQGLAPMLYPVAQSAHTPMEAVSIAPDELARRVLDSPWQQRILDLGAEKDCAK